MKKTIKAVIAIVIGLAVGFAIWPPIENKLEAFFDGPDYAILEYKFDDSTENLLQVCFDLLFAYDERYYDYVIEFFNSEDSFEAIREFSKNNTESNLTSPIWNDFLLTGGYKIMAENNNPERLSDIIKLHFPNARTSDALFQMSHILKNHPQFANANKDAIIDSIVSLYETCEEDEKEFYLQYIVTYYKYWNIENEETEVYKTTLRSMYDNMSEFNQRATAGGLTLAYDCWDYMFTGNFSDALSEYYVTVYAEYLKDKTESSSMIEP